MTAPVVGGAYLERHRSFRRVLKVADGIVTFEVVLFDGTVCGLPHTTTVEAFQWLYEDGPTQLEAVPA